MRWQTFKPFFDRADDPPSPVSDAWQGGQHDSRHELELLLNLRLFCGVTQYLVGDGDTPRRRTRGCG